MPGTSDGAPNGASRWPVVEPNDPTPLRVGALREGNRRLVLETLARLGPSTRAEVARATGLTTQSVGVIAGELVRDGALLVRAADGPVRRPGRPGVVLSCNPDAWYVGSISVQENALGVAVYDAVGTLRAFLQTRPRRTTAEGVLERGVESLREASRANGIDEERLRAVGVAVPGVVDGGVATGALSWKEPRVDVRAIVAGLLGRPTAVVTHTEAAVRAEQAEGLGRRGGTVVVFDIGIRPVHAVLVDGRQLPSPSGGNLQHARIPGLRTVCDCGAVGCLGTVASGPAIVAAYRRRRPGTEAETPRDVITAAVGGDRIAAAILDRASVALARAIGWTVRCHEPDLLIIAGQTGGLENRALARLLDRVRQELAPDLTHVEVAVSRLGALGWLSGAADAARALVAPA